MILAAATLPVITALKYLRLVISAIPLVLGLADGFANLTLCIYGGFGSYERYRPRRAVLSADSGSRKARRESLFQIATAGTDNNNRT